LFIARIILGMVDLILAVSGSPAECRHSKTKPPPFRKAVGDGGPRANIFIGA
jgi:hypothetical protein